MKKIVVLLMALALCLFVSAQAMAESETWIAGSLSGGNEISDAGIAETQGELGLAGYTLTHTGITVVEMSGGFNLQSGVNHGFVINEASIGGEDYAYENRYYSESGGSKGADAFILLAGKGSATNDLGIYNYTLTGNRAGGTYTSGGINMSTDMNTNHGFAVSEASGYTYESASQGRNWANTQSVSGVNLSLHTAGNTTVNTVMNAGGNAQAW